MPLATSTFRVFGSAHLVTIGAIAALAILLPLLICRNRRLARPVAVGIAVLLLLQLGGVFAYRGFVLGWPWARSLPFQLCEIAELVGAVALLRNDPRCLQVLYYWGAAGTLQAILTPNVHVAPPDPLYLLFFLGHGLAMVAIGFAVGVLGMRPTFRGAVLATLTATLWAYAIAAPFNYAFDTNFVYTCAKPTEVSLIDALGPWPWYLVWLQVIGMVSFLIAYAPWALVRARKTRAS